MKKISIITMLLISLITSNINAQYSAGKFGGIYVNYPRERKGAIKSGGIGISYEHSMGKHFSWNLSFNYFQRNIKYPVPDTSVSHLGYLSKSMEDHYCLAAEIRYYFNKKYNQFYLRAIMYGDYMISSAEVSANGVYSTVDRGHYGNNYFKGLGAGYSIPVNKSLNLEIQMDVSSDFNGFFYHYQGGINAVYIFGK